MTDKTTDNPQWVPMIVNIPIDDIEDGQKAMNDLMGLTMAMATDGYQPTGVPALSPGGDGVSVVLFQWFVPIEPDDDAGDDDKGLDMDDD